MYKRFLSALAIATMLVAFAYALAMSSTTFAASTATSKQQSFATAEQGMQAFAAALKSRDMTALRRILGSQGEALIDSGDRVVDKEASERFSKAYEESHKLDQKSASSAQILVGKDDWPFPIPLVKKGDAWYFDTAAGKQELLNRRIGRNELSVVNAVLAYVDAQEEYYQRNPQKEKLFQFAQKFVSTPGKRDGLYFPTKAGEKPSPLGPLFDARAAAGIVQDEGGKPEPYQGYYYKILKAQGPHAPGGAYNYVVNGRMIGGFALVAYPAKYGNSGVMTFMVSHDGVVYEKNLGPKTAQIAQQITRFDPDDTWKRH